MTLEGRVFTSVMPMLSGQARTGMNGFTGYDIPACLTVLQSQGCDPEIAAIFLPFWEQGTLDAIEEQREAREGTGK